MEKERFELEQCDREKPSISRNRVILSQVLACSTLFLLLISIGSSINLVTMVVPALLNAPKGLSLTETQASWYGSTAFVCQPLGSMVSGWIMDLLGRRKALCFVNLPHAIGYILLFYASNVPVLFIANALLGLGTGIMEAPSVAYVGEISDPSLRGILTTITITFASVGILLVYFVGSVLPWRTTSLICLVLPILTMILSYVVPETPIWLLSKNRKAEALNSLCWLRGWSTKEYVHKEFQELLAYHEKISKCMLCDTEISNEDCIHNHQGFLQKFYYKIKFVFFAKETLRPLILVLVYFFFFDMSGLQAMRPNLINVCKALGMHWNSNTIVVMSGFLLMIMNIVASITMKLVGKRFVALLSMLMMLFGNISLGIYAKMYLDDQVYSYNANTFPSETSVIPAIFYFVMVAGNGLGIPWVLLSEVFPFKSRGTAAGFSSAGCYVVKFIATKLYLDLEINLHIYGTFFAFSVICVLGFIFLYTYLPETENRTLSEIEEHFGGDSLIVGKVSKFIFKKKKVEIEGYKTSASLLANDNVVD